MLPQNENGCLCFVFFCRFRAKLNPGAKMAAEENVVSVNHTINSEMTRTHRRWEHIGVNQEMKDTRMKGVGGASRTAKGENEKY